MTESRYEGSAGPGTTAVLTGFVDIQPAKGELYRVRTLEVYHAE